MNPTFINSVSCAIVWESGLGDLFKVKEKIRKKYHKLTHKDICLHILKIYGNILVENNFLKEDFEFTTKRNSSM